MNKYILLLTISLLIAFSSCVKTPAAQLSPDQSAKIEEKSAPTDQRQDYVGEYATRVNENIRIYIDGKDLKIQGPGQPIMVLETTEKPNTFFVKELDVSIEFVGENSKITKLLMIRWDGQTLEAPKVK